MPAALDRDHQPAQNNSLVDNSMWDEMSDCSAEVPSENDERGNGKDRQNMNAAAYQPRRYNEPYKKAASLLKKEESKM